MTEKEKMTSGKIYDPSDNELVALRTKAHRLSKEYNELLETDEKRAEILKELGIVGVPFIFKGLFNSIMAASHQLEQISMQISISHVLIVVP